MYFVLVLSSGLSFILNLAGLRAGGDYWSGRPRFCSCRFPAVRAIPFLAVAAGPILALNLQNAFSRRIAWTNGAEAGRWALAGRITSLLAVLALLGTAWAGLLHAPFGEPPRWEIEIDPGLRGVAVKIHNWGAMSIFSAPTTAVSTSPRTRPIISPGFALEEKGIIDARHPPFPAAAATDFTAMRKQLSAACQTMRRLPK